MHPLAIFTWFADHTYRHVWAMVQVGRREAMVKQQAAALAAERAEHAALFAADARFRAEPAHGISVTADEVWAYWKADDLIDIPLALVIRNAWVHPVTMTKLGGAIAFTSGRRGQELPVDARDRVLSPRQSVRVGRDYRWQPTIDPPPAPLTPEATTVLRRVVPISVRQKSWQTP